jgi:hypothetical protein
MVQTLIMDMDGVTVSKVYSESWMWLCMRLLR